MKPTVWAGSSINQEYTELYQRLEDEVKTSYKSIFKVILDNLPGQPPCKCVVYAITFRCNHTYYRAERCSQDPVALRHQADTVDLNSDDLCAVCTITTAVSQPLNTVDSDEGITVSSNQDAVSVDQEEYANADHDFEYTGPVYSDSDIDMISGDIATPRNISEFRDFDSILDPAHNSSTVIFHHRGSSHSQTYILPATTYSPPATRYNADDFPCPVHGNTSKYACKALDYHLPPLTYDQSKPGKVASISQFADWRCSCLPSTSSINVQQAENHISADIDADELRNAVQDFRRLEADSLNKSHSDASSVAEEAESVLDQEDFIESPVAEHQTKSWSTISDDDDQEEVKDDSWHTVTSSNSEESVISHRDSFVIMRERRAKSTQRPILHINTSPDLPPQRPPTMISWSSETSTGTRHSSSQQSQGSTTLVQDSTPATKTAARRSSVQTTPRPKSPCPAPKPKSKLRRALTIVANKVLRRKTGIDGRTLPSKADHVIDRISGFVHQYADAKSRTKGREESSRFTVVGGEYTVVP